MSIGKLKEKQFQIYISQASISNEQLELTEV